MVMVNRLREQWHDTHLMSTGIEEQQILGNGATLCPVAAGGGHEMMMMMMIFFLAF